MRNSAKRGGALYSADDLRLVAADKGIQNQSTEEELSPIRTLTKEENRPPEDTHQSLTEWLEPIPPEVKTRHRRHTNVSQDPRYDRAPTAGDSECTEAPTRIPEWILPLET
jgi:predicted outer membrane repeat protein